MSLAVSDIQYVKICALIRFACYFLWACMALYKCLLYLRWHYAFDCCFLLDRSGIRKPTYFENFDQLLQLPLDNVDPHLLMHIFGSYQFTAENHSYTCTMYVIGSTGMWHNYTSRIYSILKHEYVG